MEERHRWSAQVIVDVRTTLSIVTFLNPPNDSVPNLMALALLIMWQLEMDTRSFYAPRLCDFRQMPSSAELMKQLEIRTSLQSLMSIPSLFQYALFSTCRLSIVRSVHREKESPHAAPLRKLVFRSSTFRQLRIKSNLGRVFGRLRYVL